MLSSRRVSGDREKPASRGTEASAEVLVGPPGRMVSNAGQQQWYEGGQSLTRSRWRPKGPLRPATALRPLLHPPLQSASEGIGGARGLGNLVRPESHPGPRGFPVQWADPGVKLAHFSPVSPFGPALVPVLLRADRAARTVSLVACTHVQCAVVCGLIMDSPLTDASVADCAVNMHAFAKHAGRPAAVRIEPADKPLVR